MGKILWIVGNKYQVQCTYDERTARTLYKQWERSFSERERTDLKLYSVDLDNCNDMTNSAFDKLNALKPILYNRFHKETIEFGSFDIKETKTGLTVYCSCYYKTNEQCRALAFATLDRCIKEIHKDFPDINLRVRVDNDLYKVVKPEQ